MEAALAHWATAPVVSDMRIGGVQATVKRADKAEGVEKFGYALCEIAGAATGMFVLIRRGEGPICVGYLRRGIEKFDFPPRSAVGWDAERLAEFAREVIERNFNFPPDWGVSRSEDDLESDAAAAAREAIAQLQRKR